VVAAFDVDCPDIVLGGDAVDNIGWNLSFAQKAAPRRQRYKKMNGDSAPASRPRLASSLCTTIPPLDRITNSRKEVEDVQGAVHFCPASKVRLLWTPKGKQHF
jgi:hypothetical protein